MPFTKFQLISKKFLTVSILFLIFMISVIFSLLFLNSCADDDQGALASTKPFNIKIPDNAFLTVSDIRTRGFTLTWSELDKNCEYAIAASAFGKIDDYQTALENSHIILDFTPAETLNGSYRATKIIGGKDYEIKLFVRKKNTQAAEYLSAKATLPYLDDAEILKVYADGEEMLYDKTEDAFTKTYVPGKKDIGEYTVTYKLGRQCALYIDGVKIESDRFTIKDGETAAATVVNEKNNAARDYVISIKPVDNGLPVIMINVENNRAVNSKSLVLSAEMTILDSRTNPYGIGLYSGGISIKGRGNSSMGMPKKNYNIEIESKAMMLDMAAAKKWTLTANYSDKSLMRNYIAHELYRDMGAAFSPKFRFVDLILNGDYAGTYCIGERIKVAKGRLDLPKIKVDETVKTNKKGVTEIIPPTSGDDLNGSYILEVSSTDKYSKDDIIFETKKINWVTGNYFAIKQPGKKNMSEDAYNYISKYINEAEDALFGENFTDPDNGYRKYMDVSTFIDWYIVNELFKQVDSNFQSGVYLYKPRDGKLCMGPIWDFDLGAGNANYAGCDNPEGWYARKSAWFTRLFEDGRFAAEFRTRWNEVKADLLGKTFDRIDETAKLLEKSQQMNFAKWRILGVYVWPNAGNVQERATYASEVEYLKNWLTERIEWMDQEINK